MSGYYYFFDGGYIMAIQTGVELNEELVAFGLDIRKI